MRSTLFYFTTLALPLALVSAAIASGCADSSANSAFAAQEKNGGDEDPNQSSGGTTFGSSTDASTPISSRGSPLCAVAPNKCLPDDDGTTSTTSQTPKYGTACATLVSDGGLTPIEDAGYAAKGCRLTKIPSSDDPVVPDCLDADRRGVDGTSCQNGSQCAPGFDCVEGDKGSVCRRYCCSGSCEGHTAQNGGPTFCDIQRLIDTGLSKAPVCMPLKTCKLLTEGECGPKETCAIVTENGDTGCVEIGNVKAGSQCDNDQCAVGLTCLGNPGDRRCYQLCKTGSANCPDGQQCTTGSVFPNTTYGVCKKI